MGSPLDYFGVLRYGVPTSEKEKLAREGNLPGAPKDTSEDQAAADRFAAGFLFGFRYPSLAEQLLPTINALKTSDLPFFGGDSPELQSFASQGMQQGIAEALRGGTLEDLIK